jgi:hypothetical protein
MDFAAIGELMSMNISYAKRFPDSYYRPDTKWAYVIMLDPSQRTPNYDQLDERADQRQSRHPYALVLATGARHGDGRLAPACQAIFFATGL